MASPTLTDAKRACAQAEHALWSAVLAERDARTAELDRDGSTTSMWRRMAVNRIALDIARDLHLSEPQVWRIIHAAETIRDHAPSVWVAFASGSIDASRVAIVSNALQRVQRTATRERLDVVVAGFAATHTPAELRRWLDRLVDRLEPPPLSDAERARARRHVRVSADHHGMSLLQAWIPTLAGSAIERRLHAAAGQLRDDPDQPRTVAQKRADLLCSWLTNATGTDCDISAEVAVVIEATALAGVTDTPGQVLTPDGPAPVPANWVLELAATGNALWTRLLTDAAGAVLDVTHHGYQPPQVLRNAIGWRDLTCRVSGCHVPANRCDLDHVTPWEAGGATTAANLRTLCRRHHGMKGHGLLDTDAYDPPESHLVRLPSPPMVVEYIAA